MPIFDGIIPALTYRDIAAAHDFLIEAFGFASGGFTHGRAARVDGLPPALCFASGL